MSPVPKSSHPVPHGVRAVLVAAGEGTRMGQRAGTRKPLLQLLGRSLLEHACAAFDACDAISSLVIVAHPEDVQAVRSLAPKSPAFRKLHAVLAGGSERSDSVRLGCAESFKECSSQEPPFDLIAVHDAARPLIQAADIQRAVEAAREYAAALLAIPVRDTLKQSSDGLHAAGTLDRSGLWAAQTPQVFRATELRACQARALAEGLGVTDDAALWERYRGPIRLVEGRWDNLKVTRPADLGIAEALLQATQTHSGTP